MRRGTAGLTRSSATRWFPLVWLAVSLTSSPAPAAAAADSQTVTAVGQAAVYNKDVALARDKAIADAMRKAVEQALGAMVSSETITENYQLISDKIFSQSKGYVKSYKVLSEGEKEGIYEAKIEATVATGALGGDVQGVLAVLRAKNMPRVLVMVAEQNVNQGGANFWWGDKTFSTNLDAVENAFIDAWTPKGIRFVDRQTLLGKLSVGPALASAEPNANAVKEFAGKTGAEVVLIGKAVAKDVGAIMGTQMHSVRANLSLRAINLDTGEILASSTMTQAVGHIDPTTGGTQALQKVGKKCAEDMLAKILARWEKQVAGPSTVSLQLSNVRKTRFLRAVESFLRNHVRGVEDVRQRSYRKKVAQLEVEMKGSAQDLAMELEEKEFPGFGIEIEEITANSVAATLSQGK